MTPTFFNDLFKCCPGLREFQMTQTAPDIIEVLVESADHSARRDVQKTVRHVVRRAIPANVDVRVDCERFRPDSKFQRFRAPCWDLTDAPPANG